MISCRECWLHFPVCLQPGSRYGGILGTALTGARRAAYVNEAGVGTASMMHGASRNDNPIREGLVAMIGPAIDSGLVCTLTAFPILIAGNYASEGGIKGLYIALNSFEQLLPGYGHYLLMVMVFFFAFSTMFSYSYYGLKCTNFLFGAENAKYYNYFYLVMIVVAAMIPLGAVVAIMDLAFALMALPTMTSLLLLAPRGQEKDEGIFCELIESSFHYKLMTFPISPSKFGVNTPLPIFALISSGLQKRPPSSSSLGCISPS